MPLWTERPPGQFTRVVSLVPSITENLILLGLVPVGRTSFCIEPKTFVNSIPVVGGTKTLRVEKIVELNPDLVIANQEENRKEDIELLIQKGLNVWLTYPKTVESAIDLMASFENLLSHPPKISFAYECREAWLRMKNLKQRNIPLAVLIWKNPWMAAGGDSFLNDMLEVAGGKNVFEAKGRYPMTSEEEIIELHPKLLLLPSEPYAFSQAEASEWAERFLKKNLSCRVECISGEDLCWFGPRISRGLRTLEKLIASV